MSNIVRKSYPVVSVSKSGDQFAIVQGGQLKKLTREGLGQYIQELAPNTLIALSDTPVSYVGQQGKALVVNATEDAMVFEAATAGNFLALSDSPVSYGAQAGKIPAVNGLETALEFIDNAFIELSDTPASYTGTGGNVARVNAVENAVEFVDSTQVATTGWARYTDTVYTLGAPFTIAAGVTASLPNNAGSVDESQIPLGVTSLYDGTVITPENNGDCYMISIRFKCDSTVNNGSVSVSIDIGGAQGMILNDTRRLIRGIGVENFMEVNFVAFSGATFIANGGTVKFESVDGNTDVYDISYVISRIHKAY